MVLPRAPRDQNNKILNYEEAKVARVIIDCPCWNNYRRVAKLFLNALDLSLSASAPGNTQRFVKFTEINVK